MIVLLPFLVVIDSFAFVASDIDPSTSQSDVGTIIIALMSFLVLLFGYKKILSLLGK